MVKPLNPVLSLLMSLRIDNSGVHCPVFMNYPVRPLSLCVLLAVLYIYMCVCDSNIVYLYSNIVRHHSLLNLFKEVEADLEVCQDPGLLGELTHWPRTSGR